MAVRTLRVDFVGDRLYNDGERIVAPRVQAGQPWVFSLQLTEDDGEPKDITGWTADGQIRHAPRSSSVIQALTVEIVEATSTVVCRLTAAETAALRAKKGVYDVRLLNAAGDVVGRLIEGDLEVDNEVTRDG